MKASLSEITKNKVFVFFPQNSNPQELNDFEKKVGLWMDKKTNEVDALMHSDFVLETSDGGKAIASIIDVNKDQQDVQIEIDLG